MCGIAGLISRDLDAGAARAAVERMTAAQAHRGPDDSGIYVRSENGLTVVLGHRRLSIIDPTPEAAQPFRLKDDTTVLTF
ncbi:MAG TPA: hypothetical protein VE967_12225, partial [Gemmatimonadaceae bacterium]|nr:hypothetical protein [Gemmatimonadaceae bacterium]